MLDIHNTYLCYKDSDDVEEFTSIADVLEFGPPADLDDSEMEIMNDHLYTFDKELVRFVPI